LSVSQTATLDCHFSRVETVFSEDNSDIDGTAVDNNDDSSIVTETTAASTVEDCCEVRLTAPRDARIARVSPAVRYYGNTTAPSVVVPYR